MSEVTQGDLANLTHMLGMEKFVPMRHKGYRNFYVAGAETLPSMERLVEAGLVREITTLEGVRIFGATELGMDKIGMNPAQKRRATAG